MTSRKGTLRTRTLVHVVVEVLAHNSRCLLGCGGYVNDTAPEPPDVIVTCLHCLTFEHKMAAFFDPPSLYTLFTEFHLLAGVSR